MSTAVRSSSKAPPRRLYVAEPVPLFEDAPPLVTDCSVVAAWLFGEPAASTARDRMRGCTLHAPDLLPYELANVGRTQCRRGADADRVASALADLPTLGISLHRPEPDRLLAIAQQHDLTAYDAAYLWLAAELRAPLATFDERLAQAARRHLGTP